MAASTKACLADVPPHGGKILRRPDEVPGGVFTLQIEDPQGTHLALVSGA